jgi:hypothetical protein
MAADRSKEPRGNLSSDRARRFCQALAAESEGRRSAPWWSSIHAVAQRLEPTTRQPIWPARALHLDWDAQAVDEVLERLTLLRSEMLPPPSRN